MGRVEHSAGDLPDFFALIRGKDHPGCQLRAGDAVDPLQRPIDPAHAADTAYDFLADVAAFRVADCTGFKLRLRRQNVRAEFGAPL